MNGLKKQASMISKVIAQQSKFYDSGSGKFKMGEAYLVTAIIGRAIEDLPGINSKSKERILNAMDAFRFIFFKKNRWFKRYCDWVELDADYVRNKIKKWLILNNIWSKFDEV